jgi:hypothetical protein
VAPVVKYCLLSCYLLLVFSCSRKDSMTGAYRMLSQYGNSQSIDTASTNPQLKIFTGNYVMYARHAGPIAAFGVRQFIHEKRGIAERNIYGMSDTSEFVTPDVFHLEIDKTSIGYRQVIPSVKIMGQDFYIEEDYKRVDAGQASPVDGAWRLTRAFTVKGNDTTHLQIVQFKFYQSGNFIFGHSLRDSAFAVPHAGIGFGTFSMQGEDALVENVETSNYPSIVGKSFNIKVMLSVPPNNLQQIVDELDGVKSVEFYERMVKGTGGGVETW